MDCLPKISCLFCGNPSKTINTSLGNLCKIYVRRKGQKHNKNTERATQMEAKTTENFKKNDPQPCTGIYHFRHLFDPVPQGAFYEAPLPVLVCFCLQAGRF